jgi:hypothetical protein
VVAVWTVGRWKRMMGRQGGWSSGGACRRRCGAGWRSQRSVSCEGSLDRAGGVGTEEKLSGQWLSPQGWRREVHEGVAAAQQLPAVAFNGARRNGTEQSSRAEEGQSK